MMLEYRTNPPTEINQSKVVMIKDYLNQKSTDLRTGQVQPMPYPVSDVIQFFTEDDTKITIRPSGTEPKIKFYVSVKGDDEADADTHPERNKVLNCLGSPFEPTVDIGGDVELAPGDTLLLCTDGVWSALPETALVALLSADSVLASFSSAGWQRR